MKIKVDITLTMEDDTEEERTMQVQIEESIGKKHSQRG